MIYWQLFWGFLQVGCLAFGGAYAAIPFIRDIVLAYGWLDEEAISQIIAISESTPGPIMINMATYVGQSQGGCWGAVIATVSVVIPSFLVTIIIMALLRSLISNRWVRVCLSGLMPCIAGIIMATGLVMLNKALICKDTDSWCGAKLSLMAVLIIIEVAYYKYKHTPLSPIALIIIAALLGAVTFR
ncbi:MAG: chromate transporter [bacterium]|nr:chromate transporter [bacterium]